MGEEEVVNNITEISVSDANTGVLLKTEILTNERSSASLRIGNSLWTLLIGLMEQDNAASLLR